MRVVTTAVIMLALLLGVVGCRQPAATRWGITKPTADAESKLADAYRLLYALKFDSARSAYAELVKECPKSAEAHLGLSMSYRYTNFPDDALAEARTALELDPEAAGALLNYADLLLPIRAARPEGMTDAERYAESEKCNLKAAASRHPLNAHAHTGLWASYMAQGRLADARAQLRELGRKNYYPQPLLDFCRNLLVGLEPNAILFTNGDNDTYPAWVLQVCDGFRPDVAVTNVSLINIPAVVKMMRDSLGLPVTFSDSEIDALAPKLGTDNEAMVLVSQQVIDNVIANAATAGRPVYVAQTVSHEVVQRFEDRLVLEGLVYRVGDSGPAERVDLERVGANMEKYRLAWPDKLPAWPANMSPLTGSYARMVLCYTVIASDVARLNDSLGRKAEAAAALAEAAEWARRGGRTDGARSLVGAALERDPDNARAKKLSAALDRADAGN